MRSVFGLFASLLLLSSLNVSQAQVSSAPSLINFQGRLATPNGNPVPDGSYSVQFSLYDALTAGTQKWTQTVSNVTVKNGTFAVLLSGFASSTFDGNLWLEIKVGTDAPLSPRQQLVSVAFALKANTVPDNSITNAKIHDLDWSKLTGVPSTLLTLPYSKTLNSSASLFSVYNTGVGYALVGQNSGGSSAVRGAAFNGGIGVDASSDSSYAVFGQSNSGTAIYGVTNSLYGVEGQYAPTGDRGFLGANGYGVYGNSITGTGVYGLTSSAGNYGGYFINTGSNGVALKAVGKAQVGVLQVTGGSDVAEPYQVASWGKIKPAPGMLVAIDPAHIGQMKVAGKAYDRSVGGILSGAKGIHPGMTLQQEGTVADGTLPVASVGRVWCWCDADANGAILPGDLLTSSATPGHAMRVTNFNRANGAVIGKAMSPLKHGKGLVLVLVSLK